MQVVFGWHLDGPTFPETIDGSEFSLNSAVVGAAGLIDLLEGRLGLTGPQVRPALRIAQYLARLRAIEDGSQFYSGSLDADNWATSRLLLGWRDGLIAAGWVPEKTNWSSERLATLAAAENLDALPLELGHADRLKLVVARIQAPSPIESLTLVDTLDLLPPSWVQLINALQQAGTVVTPAKTTHQTADNDLGLLQQRLLSGAKAELCGDGSLTIAQVDDEWLAAEIAGGWLAADPEANTDLAIIRQGDSTVLDEACHRVGLPRPGGSERSPWRGAIQVLPLAFETAWDPADARRLLELLIVPGAPIRPSIGQLFAEALRESPGIGGPVWQQAWAKASNRFHAVLEADETDAVAIDKALTDEESNWRAWLEPDRFDRDQGMPCEAAEAVCRRVQKWAQARAAVTDDIVYRYAADAATALVQVISISGLEKISKAQIDRMIDAVLADGIPHSVNVAEAAPWTVVDRPGGIWGPASAVLWWGFTDPGFAIASAPWSESERSELTAAGCHLEMTDAALALENAAWRRAFLNAGEQVLCVMPRTVAGEAIATHPLWHEIRTMVEGSDCIVDGRTLLGSSELALGGRSHDQEAVETVALPTAIRDWKISPDLVSAREQESATSLETLFGCPFKWAVQYQARIQESPLLDVADNNRLKGNLSHAVIADLVTGPALTDEAAIREKAEALIARYLPRVATPFLMAGRTGDREDVRCNTVEAAVALYKILQNSGLSVVGAEQRHTGSLDDQTNLIGYIDLQLETTDGNPAIIDLKWTNRDRYREEEIAEGCPVQLATYSHLLKGKYPAGMPPAGYFMLKQQRLLAATAEPFPKFSHVPGSDLATVWHAIVTTYADALARLRNGNVTAAGVEAETANGADATADAENIRLEPPCRFCAYGHLCGQKELR